MEVVEVAKRIQDKIKLLERARGTLEGLANDKALTAAMYDKELAVTLIKLKNGVAFTLDGASVKDPPATLCEKIAKGICWESKLQADQAEANYKLAITKLECVETEMNALQSINRYLDISPEHGRTK